MKKFILFYKGPATPPDASHEGWPIWFSKLGDKLVDRGSPMQNGHTLQRNGVSSDSATNFNGYSIIQAENMEEAMKLIADHPFLTLGTSGYTVEIFELPM